MAQSTRESGRFNWMLPSFAALVVVVVYLSMALWAEDAEFFVSTLLIAPALTLVSIASIVYALIVRKSRHKRLTLLFTVAALWLACIFMFFFDAKYDIAIRTASRWLIWSRNYKTEVTAQWPSRNGEFKHIEWDSWGLVPAGFTTAYLVFDPSDSLSAAAKRGQPGKVDGIPCAVLKLNRLEKNWYTVVFYTDQDWNHCD
jgi:hypothetical protein